MGDSVFVPLHKKGRVFGSVYLVHPCGGSPKKTYPTAVEASHRLQWTDGTLTNNPGGTDAISKMFHVKLHGDRSSKIC
jgi:hypothetical protein